MTDAPDWRSLSVVKDADDAEHILERAALRAVGSTVELYFAHNLASPPADHEEMAHTAHAALCALRTILRAAKVLP